MKSTYQQHSVGPVPCRAVVPKRNRRVGSRGAFLAALTAAAIVPGLQAQTFTYSSGDLIAAFRRTGSSDLEVNLGSVDAIKSLAPGATVSYDGARYDVNTQLLGTFGDVNSLTFSVFGTQGNTAGSSPANTSWLTLGRSDPDVQTAAPNRFTASKSGNIQSAISGIAGLGATTGALQYAPNAGYPPSSATALVIPTTGGVAVNSYTTKYLATGGLASLIPSPGIENTTSATFSGTPGSQVVSDLYEYLPGTPGAQATYLGSFSFSNNGQLSFTAVPEPGTAAMIGLGLLLFVSVSRFRNLSSKP